MKIAFLVHDYHRAGGHSRYVAELATRFARDHEVHVFANHAEREDSSNIIFHTVPAWRANALTTVLTFALPATFQIGSGFDIVHSQGFCGFRGNVFTSHICNRAWHLALQKLEGGVTFRERIFNLIAGALEYSVYHFANGSAVVAISHRVARDLVRFYRCPAPIQVIYHGVDLQVFSPANIQRWRSETRAQYGLAEDEPVFLYVGDMRKGAARCILALAQVPRGHLLLVSRTPEQEFRKIADRAGVASRVHLIGFTNQVERVYAAADAFVFPTPYDAFAMVVLEAMATGLPVVSSREAGASELIRHGENGLLLDDTASVPELARLMTSLIEDRARATELGHAARQSVECLSWDAVAEKTMRVYQQLLENRN